jgi:hypothetical protein
VIQFPQRDDAVPRCTDERGGWVDCFPEFTSRVEFDPAEAGTDGKSHSRRPVPVGQLRLREGGLYRSGPVLKHKAGDFEVQNWEGSRYLVYLNNRAAGKGSFKTIDLRDQKTAPLTPKSFIYN